MDMNLNYLGEVMKKLVLKDKSSNLLMGDCNPCGRKRQGMKGRNDIVCMVIECGGVPVLNKYELGQTSKQIATIKY